MGRGTTLLILLGAIAVFATGAMGMNRSGVNELRYVCLGALKMDLERPVSIHEDSLSERPAVMCSPFWVPVSAVLGSPPVMEAFSSNRDIGLQVYRVELKSGPGLGFLVEGLRARGWAEEVPSELARAEVPNMGIAYFQKGERSLEIIEAGKLGGTMFFVAVAREN